MADDLEGRCQPAIGCQYFKGFHIQQLFGNLPERFAAQISASSGQDHGNKYAWHFQ
ncbi:MAG: hypothetical protein HKP58_20690 [Desulfatitalea sp.]|nr:hypothetical protein [Desulfatitalea sp.]NNK02837.1 hypothetical protein [Desulfatitalea sp.]